jgi:Zn-dependent M28 family amino/carboxypeptidase
MRYFAARVRTAQVITNPTSTDTVAFGSTVTFRRHDGRVQKYRIVGEDEADPKDGSIRCVRPLMTNSDHANFAIAGIPAFRLVAGFDDPAALVRLVLTAADTRDKVEGAELATAAQLAACLTAAACQADAPTAANWRARVMAG